MEQCQLRGEFTRRGVDGVHGLAGLDVPDLDHGVERAGGEHGARLVHVDGDDAQLVAFARVPQLKRLPLPTPYLYPRWRGGS